jgi:Bacterial SH3 domain
VGKKRILVLAVAAATLAAGCAQRGGPPPTDPAAALPEADPGVYRRADADRMKLLELEIDRLQADLRAAEQALVAVESGMRGGQTPAEAVSMLAEARIAVDRAGKRAPWRADVVTEARGKLDEAERELAAGHIGSAVFFVSRASRIAATLLAEAELASKTPTTRYVKGGRVNLRAEPTTASQVLAVLPMELPVFPEADAGEWVLVRTVSGKVGWVHASLLRGR